MKNLILEIERIQLIRKKCKADELFCSNCGEVKDFVALYDITSLFETHTEKLLGFIKTNSIHYTETQSSEILVCVNSFLNCIQSHKQLRPIKLVQGGKQ